MIKSFSLKKKQKGKSFNKLNNLIMFKNLKFNTLQLISTSHGRVTDKQILAVTAVINKTIKKIGIYKLNMFPYHPITKKSLGIRMGKGKGSINHYIFNASIGIILCSIQTAFFAKAYKALKLAQIRLPIRTKIISL